MKTFLLVLLIALTPLSAAAQSILQLPAANLPLSGSEYLYVVQNGIDHKTQINDIFGVNGGNAAKFSSIELLPPANPFAVIGNTPFSGVYASGGGPIVDLCGGPNGGYNFGCPSVGHIMADTFIGATTLGNAGVQESALNVYLADDTGYAPAWTTSTDYTSASEVNTGTYTYQETVASCESASSGNGPSGTGSGIVDNTCRWTALGEYGLLGKIAISGIVKSDAGGAASWVGDFFNIFESGWNAQFGTGAEIDVVNDSGTDATGAPMTIDLLYLGGAIGTNPITAYVSISPYADNGTNLMAHDGVFAEGQYTIKGNTFRDSTHSATAFFCDNLGVHSTSCFYDSSTTPVGMVLGGTYSSTFALDATSTIEVYNTAAGADLIGFEVTNAGTTVNTTDAAIALNTGNSNSYARIDLFDSDYLDISAGSALTGGIVIGTAAGPIQLNPTTTLKINGTAAVSCTYVAAPTDSLVITDGLVTHC